MRIVERQRPGPGEPCANNHRDARSNVSSQRSRDALAAVAASKGDDLEMVEDIEVDAEPLRLATVEALAARQHALLPTPTSSSAPAIGGAPSRWFASAPYPCAMKASAACIRRQQTIALPILLRAWSNTHPLSRRELSQTPRRPLRFI